MTDLLVCLDCGHRRAWHATTDGRCTHEILPVGGSYTRCPCQVISETQFGGTRHCPLCGSTMHSPWDAAKQAWRCNGCGAWIDVFKIGVETITAGLAGVD